MGMSVCIVHLCQLAGPVVRWVNCTLIKFTLLAAVEKCSQASVEFKEVGLAGPQHPERTDKKHQYTLSF